MPYATASDVAIDLGSVDDIDPDRVETLLDRAEARIRLEAPDLDERVSDGRVPVVLIKQVESEMVADFLRNPEGSVNTSTYETVGPFSRQQSRNFGATGAGRLELSDRHRQLLGISCRTVGSSVAPAIQVPPLAAYMVPVDPEALRR